jgi:hypothetical protein
VSWVGVKLERRHGSGTGAMQEKDQGRGGEGVGSEGAKAGSVDIGNI